MAYLEKQPHANNGTHDPPLPSQRSRPWHPGRGTDGSCCPGCCKPLFLIAVAAVVLTGLVILIFTFVINPHEMKFHVTDTSLADSTPPPPPSANETLRFKLNLNVTIGNTNKKIGIHFYSTESRAYCDGEEFNSWESSMSFNMPPRSSTGEQYGGSYEGQRRMSFSSPEIKSLTSGGVMGFSL